MLSTIYAPVVQHHMYARLFNPAAIAADSRQSWNSRLASRFRRTTQEVKVLARPLSGHCLWGAQVMQVPLLEPSLKQPAAAAAVVLQNRCVHESTVITNDYCG
jgi:hypothetical protein